MTKSSIVFILGHSLYVRNFWGSGLIPRLAVRNPDLDIHILTTAENLNSLIDAGKYQNISVGTISEIQPKSWLREFFRSEFREIAMTSRSNLNSTYFTKVGDRKKRNLFSFIYYYFVELLSTFLDLEKLCLNLDDRMFSLPKRSLIFFKKTNPSLVLFSSLIHDQTNILDILRAARNMRVPIWGFVSSWDNLTSKGPFFLKPDKLLIWGKIQVEQAIREHSFKENEIKVVGAPQFDVLFERDPDFSREKFLLDRGLDPDKKLIFFAGTTKHKAANEPEIVRKLAELIRRGEGAFGKCQLWYRPHPRMLYSLDDSFCSEPGFYFDDSLRKQREQKIKGYSTSGEDLVLVSRALKSCDILISAFSTMIIEAAMLGTPSIIVKFAQGKGVFEDVEGLSKYKHIQEIYDWKYLEQATSFDDLQEKIAKILMLDKKIYQNILREQATMVANNPIQMAQDLIIEEIESELLKGRSTEQC